MDTQKVTTYKNLVIWQKAKNFVVLIYEATDKFPQSEQFGITMQLRRAAISIPSNVAEGFNRGSKKEQVQFLRIAYGSGAEIETQLVIERELGYLEDKVYNTLEGFLSEIMKMLNVLISKFNNTK